MNTVDLNQKFNDPDAIVIYSTHILTRCPICGNLFPFMDSAQRFEKVQQAFNGFNFGSVVCCTKNFLLQRMREQDAIHVEMGRILEKNGNVEGHA